MLKLVLCEEKVVSYLPVSRAALYLLVLSASDFVFGRSPNLTRYTAGEVSVSNGPGQAYRPQAFD